MLNTNLAGNIVKIVIFGLLSIFIVFANFFLENSYGGGMERKEEQFPDRGIVRFFDSGSADNSALVNVKSVPDDKEYIFELKSGKFWANFLISDGKVNIVADRVVFIPDHAVFDLEFDNDKISISVFDGDVYIGFLEKGANISRYVDEYSPLFVNRLSVPRDTQVSISLKKLDERIRSLLYLKLLKEIKYSAVPASLKESAWVKENSAKDNKFIESVKQEYISDVIYKGASHSDTKIGDLFSWIEEKLSFIPEKNQKIIFDHLFSYLDDAVYYANKGDKVNADYYLEKFTADLASLPSSLSGSEKYYKKFDSYIDNLSIFGPSDSQYQILEKLLEGKFSKGKDMSGIIKILWRNVYKGMNSGEVYAEDALNSFYDFFDAALAPLALLGKYENKDFYKQYIAYYNQLFDNLFLRQPLFYKEEYFAIKHVLETSLMSLYEEGQSKDELSQELISNKIDFLKRLMKFFFEGEITVDEAKKILARLVKEINDLMPEKSDAAVLKLFEEQIKEIGDFYGYLKSPEYQISKTYGATQAERYKSYLQEKDKIWSFVNIQEDVLGQNSKQLTEEDIKKEIKGFFEANNEVSELEVLDIEDLNQRYVKVKGVIGGYPFEASFDRDKANIKDVYVYGELVSDRPVKLENFLSLLKDKFADASNVSKPNVAEKYTEETFAQRAARIYIAEKVSGFGFEINIDNVSIIDENKILYRIEDVFLKGYEDLKVTFDFSMTNEKAKNVFLSAKGKPLVLDSEYTLEELKNIAIAEADYSGVANTGKILR